MSAEDGVRWLTLLSGSILFYSTLLQLLWQRTQAARDAKPAAHASVPKTTPAATAVIPKSNAPAATVKEEAANIAEFEAAQRENALRPFFDKVAFRLFLFGFAVSVISSALDLLAHGWLRAFLQVSR